MAATTFSKRILLLKHSNVESGTGSGYQRTLRNQVYLYRRTHDSSKLEKMGRVQTYSDNVHRYFMQDSLRRNSSLLILSQAINAGAAFLFWIICARLFTTSQVGMAVAIVAFGLLVSTFTNLGLPNTVIRFLPTSKRPGGLFTCSLYLATSCSIVGALLSIVLIKFLVPKLGIVQSTEYSVTDACATHCGK